ncbi:Metal-dependent hydrolase, endonuclease/exonuclease/phosphatase family [Nitrosomonas marina]|uniref:Metal-dependent hydrolase, endonuclease/exonuclease/phosphatase family n=1 Tax=Nitrosomonas marina TaxID=917 RepID=A0A1H9ZNU2_9PROT|nr:endonuclease/exonuclease/phosphatase family protein [Nitrosomonas marina]SES82496.1 Metal-dependent hydrolase, endonuclease/exonuclease/phosphatase family [Nitrosomonas marina]
MKLLSWNIQWGRGMDGRVDLQRIVETICRLDHFDIICLQEVAVNFPELPGSQGENQLEILLSLLQGYTAVYSPATDIPDGHGKRSQFGNMILSRLPIGQVWRHLLPWNAEPETPSMQRTLIEVVIFTASGPVRVLTTHLEYYSRRQREIQIEAIRRLHVEAHSMAGRIFESAEKNGPFKAHQRPSEAILCGDMNFPVSSDERLQLLAPFENDVPAFYDTRTLLYPDVPHTPTVGIHPVDFVDQPECFDYIFITEGLKGHLKSFQTDSETQASDHQPVWIELS